MQWPWANLTPLYKRCIEDAEGYSMIIIGHRGASGNYPENTLSAFQHAAALGCPWVELDVHQLEGELLVIHDEQLDRTTNGSGSLAAAGLAAVRRLDAGNDEQVPLLSEVLTLLDGKVGINVELKGPGTAEPTSQLLRKACQTGRWRADQFLLSAFDHAELQRADPIFARGVLWGRPVPDMVERSLAMGGQWMNIALKAATEDRITAAQQAGLKVAVYTVNEPADLAAMRALKVDAVFCDFPERGLQG
jgi:glycerophosphoryl diester phosphodiesterase|tara:strand:+ start:614 stop:1357 length:744 start_codon:yes stop_codon:yes gene_type:complete